MFANTLPLPTDADNMLSAETRLKQARSKWQCRNYRLINIEANRLLISMYMYRSFVI